MKKVDKSSSAGTEVESSTKVRDLQVSQPIAKPNVVGSPVGQTMNIYEFITPSDPIIFKADDDKVAFACALLLGNGKAGCDNKTTGQRIPSMLMFSKEPEKEIENFIGGDFKEFIESNKSKIKDCFNSFAYGSMSDRQTFDDACEAITDLKKLKAFKAKHEDRNRSSMSEWVKGAWSYAERMS